MVSEREPQQLHVGPASAADRKIQADRLLTLDPTLSNGELAKRLGCSTSNAQRLKDNWKQRQANPSDTLLDTPKSSGAGSKSMATAPAPSISPGVKSTHAGRLAPTYKRLSNVIREPWDDPELPPLTDKDAMDFALPMVDTLELFGHTDKIKYVAPGEVISVLIAHWKPALKRLGPKKMAGPDNSPPTFQTGPQPHFQAPPGMSRPTAPNGDSPRGTAFVPPGIDPNIGVDIDRPYEPNGLTEPSF